MSGVRGLACYRIWMSIGEGPAMSWVEGGSPWRLPVRRRYPIIAAYSEDEARERAIILGTALLGGPSPVTITRIAEIHPHGSHDQHG